METAETVGTRETVGTVGTVGTAGTRETVETAETRETVGTVETVGQRRECGLWRVYNNNYYSIITLYNTKELSITSFRSRSICHEPGFASSMLTWWAWSMSRDISADSA